MNNTGVPPEGVAAIHLSFLLVAERPLDVKLIDYLQEMGSEMKGTGLYVAKRGSDGMTSCFVTLRTNLFPLYGLTHGENRMESVWSELTACHKLPFCTEEGGGGASKSNTLVVNYLT